MNIEHQVEGLLLIKISGDWPAYLVTLTDKSTRSPAHIYYLWVTMGKLTYQLIGAGAVQYEEQLRETVFSLRPLTKNEPIQLMVSDYVLPLRKEVKTYLSSASVPETSAH